jgi:teichuronic acid biosynthesis glycosyltransferase TuaC
MKLLMVTNNYPTAQQPGVGNYVRRQEESLRELGVEIDLLHVDRRQAGRRVYRTLPGRLLERVAAFDPDLVHVLYGGVMADIVTRSVVDRPLVVSFQGTDLLGGPGRNILDRLSRRFGVRGSRRAARRAAGIIVVSETLRHALPRGIDPERVYVLSNGLGLSLFRPLDRAECRAQLGWAPERKHVLFPAPPGRPEKRFPLAQAAVELVRAAGTAADLHALEGVPHDEVPVWINAADVVVLTSTHEGSPNVVKEALACDVALVSVDVGDVRERLTGVSGCFIAEATAADLAEKIGRAFSYGDRVKGRGTVEDFSLERVAERLLALYERVL